MPFDVEFTTSALDFGTQMENVVRGIDGHSPKIEADGYWYAWDDTDGVYYNTLVRANGERGEDGKSAYQNAVEAGYTGTEEEFGEMMKTLPVYSERAESSASAASSSATAAAESASNSATIYGNVQTIEQAVIQLSVQVHDYAADAAQAKTAAETAMSNAQQSKINAAASEANALAYKNDAEASARAISTVIGDARDYANRAESAAETAENHADNANSYATAAATSATKAVNNATSASNAATRAQNAQGIAETAMSSALTSENKAKKSETNAATSASAAESAAEIARTYQSAVSVERVENGVKVSFQSALGNTEAIVNDGAKGDAGILTLAKAEYEAHKAEYDASDFILAIDDDCTVMSSDISYGSGTVKAALDDLYSRLNGIVDGDGVSY